MALTRASIAVALVAGLALAAGAFLVGRSVAGDKSEQPARIAAPAAIKIPTIGNDGPPPELKTKSAPGTQTTPATSGSTGAPSASSGGTGARSTDGSGSGTGSPGDETRSVPEPTKSTVPVR